MSKRSGLWLVVILVVAMALTACGSPSGTSSGVPSDAALKVTGSVDSEVGWTEADLKAMSAIDVESTNKDGVASTYTGVPINDLLGIAGVASGATTAVFVADDGYTAEVALSDLQGCSNCIVSFRNQGGFSTVLPDFPGNVQVKGVVEIQVK